MKFVPPMTQKSNNVPSVHVKTVEFERFVTTNNDDLDMIKTNITANISKASHARPKKNLKYVSSSTRTLHFDYQIRT